MPGWVNDIRPAMMTLNKVLLYTLANFERGKGCCCSWPLEPFEPASATVASVLSATKTCEDTLALRTDILVKVLQLLGDTDIFSPAETCLLWTASTRPQQNYLVAQCTLERPGLPWDMSKSLV